MASSTAQFKPKPKSRDPFYSVSPLWADITPIPLQEGIVEDDASTEAKTPQAPGLATIAYSTRYSEAMSYLRAVMAANEFSVRSVALTEDIISMNPAHYTVWLFRMKCLRFLWNDGDNNSKSGTTTSTTISSHLLQRGVAAELTWLDGVSERNLKNYQIWHHRQTLLSLLPNLPDTEVPFLTHMLGFDAKNYHVWTYRQWLCRRFREPLLTSSIELQAMETMLDEDLRNNSAWNHRYFVVFGAEELDWLEAVPGRLRKHLFTSHDDTNDNNDNSSSIKEGGLVLAVDEDIVSRELEYTKSKIELAPQNPSAWNYLRSVLYRAGIPLADMKDFCEGYAGDGDVYGEHVQSSHAVEWLAEIYAREAEEDDDDDDGEKKKKQDKARQCLMALAEKWDPIRRKFWEYKANKLGVGALV